METHERCDYHAYQACQNIGCHYEEARFVVKTFWLVQRALNHWQTGRDNQEAAKRAMEEHSHEEFIVVEANAVCDPWAVMVHLENALVAL